MQTPAEPSTPADPQATEARRRLHRRLFPEGIPRLWCPTVTHFQAARQPDPSRIARHLDTLAPYVGGLLVPGSTGEGWEMSDAEILELLEVLLELTPPRGMRLLIGVLKTEVPAMQRCLEEILAFLRRRSGAREDAEALSRCGVVGFTICPPKGATWSQPRLTEALSSVLACGLPFALYQLPQVTQNELAPETVAALAARFPNFHLFKDTSGHDRVVTSGVALGGVFLVRGAEGGYARWTRAGGGPYDGLLLSTANVFAPELAAVLDHLEAGRHRQATELAARLERVVQAVFQQVEGFPGSNPFTHTNKLLDHARAYGEKALLVPPPLLHDGRRLPATWIPPCVDWLRKEGLLPRRGYLE